jgi:hypothetical protein
VTVDDVIGLILAVVLLLCTLALIGVLLAVVFA